MRISDWSSDVCSSDLNTHSPDTVCAPTLGVHRNRPRERETNMTQSEPLIPARPSVAIIGAGFGGLAAAHYLKQAGIDSFTIYEKADRLGGVWRENTYPGAACDIPSHLYSYSFEQH